MANVIIPNVFAPNTLADANAVNANFTAVANAINSGLTGYYYDASATPYGLAPTNTGALNLTALNTVLTAAQGDNGGTIIIPTFTTACQVSGTWNLGTFALIVAGSSPQSELVQQVTGNFISVVNNSPLGVLINSLKLNMTACASGIGLYTSNCQNIKAENVYFANCPTAAYFDNSSLQCGLTNCTIENDSQGGTVSTVAPMVAVFGAQDYIVESVIRQMPIGKGGPRHNAGFGMGNFSDFRATNVHFSDTDYGLIILQDGAKNGVFTACRFDSYTQALNLQSLTPAGNINCLYFSNVEWYLTTTSTSALPGAFIDTNGGPNTNYDNLQFTSCTAAGWGGAGLNINAGENIKVVGGRYSSNGQSSATGAGILISGGNLIDIDSANCTGQLQDFGNQTFGVQPYGIAVTGGTNITLRGCNLSGNIAGALYVPTPISSLEVYDCKGYNDVPTVITASMPTSGVGFSAQTAGATPYYGPATFEVTGGTITSIAFYASSAAALPEYTSPLTSGTFDLSPGQYCKINYTGSPSFVMVGR